MVSVVQAIAFFSEPPGSYIYQVALLFVLAGLAVRSTIIGAKRRAFVFWVLAGLRLAVLVAGLLISGLPLYHLIIIPPLDRAVACLTIFGLAWAFANPQPSRAAYTLAIAVVVLAAIATVASWLAWADAVGVGSVYYNNTLQDTLWLAAQLFLLGAGLLALLVQRPQAWQIGMALLAVLFVGETLHYAFPIADLSVAGFVRLAELIVWPLAALALWRRPVASTAPAIIPVTHLAPPAPQTISQELLQAELEAANERNQKLRETNRLTRQQLAETSAALAEKEARLAEALQSHKGPLPTTKPAEPAMLDEIASLRAQLAHEQAARAQADAAVLVMEVRLAGLGNTASAAGNKTPAATVASEELLAVRHLAQSQTQLATNLGEQLAAAQALQTEEAAARQAAEARLANSQADLDELRRGYDQAQGQLAKQIERIESLQQEIAQLQALAGEEDGPGRALDRAAQLSSIEETAADVLSPETRPQPWPHQPVTGDGDGYRGNAAVVEFGRLKPEAPASAVGLLCPQLGLGADRATQHAFPSEANRCYRVAAPALVSFAQQRKFCLSGEYAACPIFTGALTNPTVPIDTSPASLPTNEPSKGLGGRVGRFFRRQP